MKKDLSPKIKLLPVKHVWSILCASSSIDKETNNLSIYNMLEELTLVKSEVAQKQKELTGPFLLLSLPFQLITLWERAERGVLDEQARIQVVDPKEKILSDTLYNFKME